MKKILLSTGVIAFVAAVVISATGAFFSDTETSTGNTFTAGAIDLQIDNESYVTSTTTGALVFSSTTSWALSNLTNQLFFSFDDVKPGDIGEDTISLHVTSNDAWACMAANITGTPDNGIVDPEADAGDITDGPLGGELQNYLNFTFWRDDGDNVFETGETVITGLTGSSSEIFDGTWHTIADAATTTGTSTPLTGLTTSYVGKAWCVGTLTATPVAQDGLGKTGTNGPLVRGTGFTCDGSVAGNLAQTDGVIVDVSFQAVQSRNNPAFLCANLPPLSGTSTEPVGPTVGALLSSYEQPEGEDCDVDVATVLTAGIESTTINGGIALASPGQTVCVAPGTYPEDVAVNKSITLSGAGATSTNIIGQTSGEAGAVVITADNVTVEGFSITEATGGIAALRISGAHSGITVDSNKLIAGGNNAFLTDGGQSNHTISNNEFTGSAGQPIAYVNGLASVNVASTNVDFTSNTFIGQGSLALGQEASNSDIKLNKFSAITTFADIETWMTGIAVNQNNINDSGLKVQHSQNGNTGATGTLNAENNWWGSASPAGHTGGSVDDTPISVVPYPEN